MTTKITKIDRAACRQIEDGAVEALREYAAGLGLEIAPAGGQYAEGSFTCKIKFSVADPVAARAIAQREWDQYCRLFDLEPRHFGTKITTPKGVGEIVGLAMNRGKYPIKISFGGKVTLYTMDVVPMIKAQVDKARRAKA